MKDFDIEERVERARSLFLNGYNCAQSVFLAYNDLYGIDHKLAATLSAPLGGGMGRLREVCGAVSGSFLIAGLQFPANDPADRTAKIRNYTVVQELAARFREINGSIVCRELLGIGCKKDNPVPSERTEQYYKKRPCAEYVAIAARIIGEKIKEDVKD